MAQRGTIRDLVCKHCGRQFQRRGKSPRYCTVSCSKLAYHRENDPPWEPVTCTVCGKTVTMPPSMARVTKFCSRVCYKNRARKWATQVCRVCGNAITEHSSRRRNYCSVLCRAEGQRKGGSISNQGYRVLSVNGQPLLEHRLVMEQLIGRALKRWESVHHKDGDRLNNAPDNLELWHRGQPAGQRLHEKIARAVELLREHGYVVTEPISYVPSPMPPPHVPPK